MRAAGLVRQGPDWTERPMRSRLGADVEPPWGQLGADFGELEKDFGSAWGQPGRAKSQKEVPANCQKTCQRNLSARTREPPGQADVAVSDHFGGFGAAGLVPNAGKRP